MNTQSTPANLSAASQTPAEVNINGYPLWNELGNIYKKAGDYQDAINAYAKAIAAMPDDAGKATLWNEMGETYLQLNQNESAAAAFQNALAISPQHEKARNNFLSVADRLMEGKPEPLAPEQPASSEQIISTLEVENAPETETEEQSIELSEPEVTESNSESSQTPLIVTIEEELAHTQPQVNDEELNEGEALPDIATAMAGLVEPADSEIQAVETEVSSGWEAPETLVSDGIAILPSPAPYQEISVDLINSNPYPIREHLNVDSLLDSVRLYGVLQPLLLASDSDQDYFVVISGERRLEAARQVGLQSVPAIVREADPRLRLELALTENLHVDTLNPLDVARTYQHLLAEYELTIEQLAERICVTEESIKNALRLLELSEGVRKALAQAEINITQALSLLELKTAQVQENMLRFVLENKLSARETIELVRKALGETAVMAAIQGGEEEENKIELMEDDEIVTESEHLVEQTIESVEADEIKENSAEVELIEEVENTSQMVLPLADVLRDEQIDPIEEIEKPYDQELIVDSISTEALLNQLPDDVTPALALQPTPLETEVDVMEQPVLEVVVAEEQIEQDLPLVATEEIVEEQSPAKVLDQKSLAELETYKLVSEINPASDRAWATLGNLYSDMGFYEDAVISYQQAIQLVPERVAYHNNLGNALSHLQRHEEAIDAFHKVIALDPEHVFAHCSLISNFRKLGREKEAQVHIKFAASRMKLEKAYNQACFQAICGNNDLAIDLLKLALERENPSVEMLKSDPDLDFLRDDPRFAELVEAYSSVAPLDN